MATLDRYFKPVTVTDAIASHSRPVAEAAAGVSSAKHLTVVVISSCFVKAVGVMPTDPQYSSYILFNYHVHLSVSFCTEKHNNNNNK